MSVDVASLSNAVWQTSSYSSGGTNCVEIAFLSDGVVALRDSKNRHKPPHFFDDDEFNAFRLGVLNDEFRR